MILPQVGKVCGNLSFSPRLIFHFCFFKKEESKEFGDFLMTSSSEGREKLLPFFHFCQEKNDNYLKEDNLRFETYSMHVPFSL